MADLGTRAAAAQLPEGLEIEAAERLFRTMAVIRRTEETLLELFSLGELSGTTHTSIGQEAIAVAVAAHLAPGDPVFSSHRCHGHCLACGTPLVELFAEIMGRRSAICGGRGGSQHLHAGDFYSNGVQGGVVGNVTGMALAEKLAGSGACAVGFMGDGTLGEGLVYESLNFASLQSLPLLLVLEHNGYSQSTPSHLGVSGSPVERPRSFGIAADEVTTNDAVELWALFRERFREVREGGRPFMQIVHTYRLAPHSKGDDDRDPAEIEAWRERDPLLLMRRYLSPERADALAAEAAREVEAAVAEARERPDPDAAAARRLAIVPDVERPVPWPAEARRYVESINSGLHALLEEDPDAFVLGEDILDPYGGAFKATKGLSTRFPERVLTTPLSEAGIVAWSTGAALRGRKPVAELMFGDFIALATDQILNHASKYRWMYGGGTAVPLVIRTPMGGRRGYGPTHSQSLEGFFTGIPGLCVVAPSHLVDPGELLLRAARDVPDPVLFLENKLLYATRLIVPESSRAGVFFVRDSSESLFPTLRLSLAEGGNPDAVIVSFGGNVPIALQACQELLMEHELLCDLIVPSLLSPLPADEVAALAGSCPRVVTFEEGPRAAAWGGQLVSALAERSGAAARSYAVVAAPDTPIPSSKALEDQMLPGIPHLVNAVVGP
ncbi:MAG: dehydrogenase E1 component subunit alpha/beta [Thermoleophilaceae bacterium]